MDKTTSNGALRLKKRQTGGGWQVIKAQRRTCLQGDTLRVQPPICRKCFRSDSKPKPRDSKPRTRKIRKTQVPTPVSLARRLLLSVADHIYGRRGVAGETSRQMFPIISLAAAPEKAFAKTRVLRRVRCTPHPQAFPSASLKRHRFSPPGRRQFTDAAKGLHTLLRPLRRFLSCVCIFAMQVTVASPSQRRNKNLRTR